MTGNEYQALAMRTNDGKSTDRVISGDGYIIRMLSERTLRGWIWEEF